MAVIHVVGGSSFHVEGTREQALARLRSRGSGTSDEPTDFTRMKRNPSAFRSDPPVPGWTISVMPAHVTAVED